jgi:exonuclease III
VYAPVKPKERAEFFQTVLRQKLQELAETAETTILAGDFNDFEFPALDRYPPYERDADSIRRTREECRRTWGTLVSPLLSELGFTDAFRHLNPETRAYSRFQRRPDGILISATRIDHVISSFHLLDHFGVIQYIPLPFTDRHALEIDLYTLQTAFRNAQ